MNTTDWILAINIRSDITEDYPVPRNRITQNGQCQQCNYDYIQGNYKLNVLQYLKKDIVHQCIKAIYQCGIWKLEILHKIIHMILCLCSTVCLALSSRYCSKAICAAAKASSCQNAPMYNTLNVSAFTWIREVTNTLAISQNDRCRVYKIINKDTLICRIIHPSIRVLYVLEGGSHS